MTIDPNKIHRVAEWATIRQTSREIAEAIFEVAKYDEKLAETLWEQQGNNEVLERAFSKTDVDVLTWDTKTVERKNV